MIRGLVVSGALGLYGGSVTRFLLNKGTFSVRAFTRTLDSNAVKDFQSRGVEVVHDDLYDGESLKKSFRRSVRCLWNNQLQFINYVDCAPGVGFEGKIQQGRNLVDAAKATDIKHFIWVMEDNRPEVKDKHHQSKAAVNTYLVKSGVPRTSLHTTFTMKKFSSGLPPRLSQRSHGSYDFPVLVIKDVPAVICAAADTGKSVRPRRILPPGQWIGKDMHVSSSFMTAEQMGNTFKESTGKAAPPPDDIEERKFEIFKKSSMLSQDMEGQWAS
ncbi:hypothetical protein M422DRAFT_246190 [Sphaerobolus stellatus SS14]|nr:hypothetical protein M422DRAFT_246190 [Sphaerobolus stellatus SS14]